MNLFALAVLCAVVTPSDCDSIETQAETLYVCYGTYADGSVTCYVSGDGVNRKDVIPCDILLVGDTAVVKHKGKTWHIKYDKTLIWTGVVNCDGTITYRWPDGKTFIDRAYMKNRGESE